MRLIALFEKNLQVNNITGATYSDPFEVLAGQTVSVESVVDVNTPSAKAFTADSATSTFTASAHGFPLGLKVQVSNAGGALPTGLTGSTDYFVIPLTANTFKLATSLANALAGTALTISDNGTGTQTATPVALAGANVKLQKLNNYSASATWTDEGSATNITGDATIWLEKAAPTSRWMRVAYTLTAGSMSSNNYVLVKGPN